MKEKFELVKPGEVRTRIAPSPTGFLHIGTARTALFNYLFAKSSNGAFVLRIEDTDLERSSPDFEKDIIQNLKWLGIVWDEGPEAGGNFGPYKQSERLNSYRTYLEKLLAEDKAYYCFCSEEELEAQRQDQMSRGEAPRYSGKCANLPPETAKKNIEEKKPFVIRFRVAPKKIKFQDLIRGEVEFDASLIGDIIIAKNLDTPLYNFAVVIDDFEMKISHVIRGEDHLANTPKQILMQEQLGFPKPKYAHLPLILGPDRTKLSKRHGSTSVTEFRKEGYLPETLINFMAFLGWSPGNEKEIYSLAALIKEFSIEKVQKGGAVFNIKKLDSINGFYIRQKSPDALLNLCIPYLKNAGLITDKTNLNYIKNVVGLHQERLKKLSEIVELTDYFFKEDIAYEKDLLKWGQMTKEEVFLSLESSEKILSAISENHWTKENLENILMERANAMKNRGELLWPLRAAITGKRASAGPFETAFVLGKEKTLKRIKQAKNIFNL